MLQTKLKIGSLVVYKSQPARITELFGKKLEIKLIDGSTVKVRPKDIMLLHPGPIESLSELKPIDGDIETARELLAGQRTTLAEFVDLAFGVDTPAATWSVWMLVQDGLYMAGTPLELEIHTPEQVAAIKAEREAKIRQQKAWDALIERLSRGQFEDQDNAYLMEVVSLARRESDTSRILSELGRAESPENAHALLLQIGYWDETVNPYPARAGLPYLPPVIAFRSIPDENRRDLTGLFSLAIDDQGSRDPDDAISLENGRLWVHIADVAAMVPPDSAADVEARARGANLYLPEGTVTMLPEGVTESLALGLGEISPALSFGLDLNSGNDYPGLEIVPSWVRVTRITYEEAEERLKESLFQELSAIAEANIGRRHAGGAIEIDLPEVKIRVVDNEIMIKSINHSISRDIVREAMLMTGEAVGRYCLEHQIPIPFTGQEAPSELPHPASSLSEMFALRRLMKPSQQGNKPAEHAGLGLPIYVQATSPLRRYLDLVVHQQLRAFLAGVPLLDEQALMERVGAADAVSGDVRWAERRSNDHWKLVYLRRHPDWQGEGIIVEKRGRRDVILIPELDLETQLYLNRELPVDSVLRLVITDVNLPELVASFRSL